MKVSIITVTYNSAQTLARTMDSIARQTYPDIEHIIVDGLSTDGTLEIIKQHQDKVAYFVSEPDRGIYDAINKGLDKATGDIIGLLNSDDVLADNRVIEHIVKRFQHKRCDVVYGNLIYQSQYPEKNKVFRHWKSNYFDPKCLKYGWMPPHPTLYCRKKVYDEVGHFDTHFRISADYDFVLRVFSNLDYKKSYLPAVLVRMSIGGVSNGSLKNIICKTKEDYQVLKKNHIGSIFTIVCKNVRKLMQFIR
jgi:glycosyltransferase